MKRKTLPSQLVHPTLCGHIKGIWQDNARTFGGHIDRARKRRATYLMRTVGIVL